MVYIGMEILSSLHINTCALLFCFLDWKVSNVIQFNSSNNGSNDEDDDDDDDDDHSHSFSLTVVELSPLNQLYKYTSRQSVQLFSITLNYYFVAHFECCFFLFQRKTISPTQDIKTDRFCSLS